MTFRKTALTAALIATVGAGVAPAASLAATAPAPIKKTYNIKVDALLLKQGNTVKTNVTVTNPESSVKDWWSRPTVQKVVQQAVGGIYEKSFNVEGYRCVPKFPNGLDGHVANWTCTLRGGDVATTAKLTFSANYINPISDQ